MPRRVIDGVHAAGQKVFLLALKGLTDPEIVREADEALWVEHPRLGRIIKECRKRGAEEMTIVGRIPHNRIFSLSPLHMDWLALRLLLGVKDFRADTVLKKLCHLIAKKGVRIISSIRYLGPYLAKRGVLTKHCPAPLVYRDIEFGTPIARSLGALDVGQTVVVKDRAIVAVEAMEGTDHCLQRAGEVAGPGCVVIKMPKPDQDLRFDVPVIGVNTIEKLAKIQAAALAIGAGKTILIDPETLEVADRLGVTIVGI